MVPTCCCSDDLKDTIALKAETLLQSSPFMLHKQGPGKWAMQLPRLLGPWLVALFRNFEQQVSMKCLADQHIRAGLKRSSRLSLEGS